MPTDDLHRDIFFAIAGCPDGISVDEISKLLKPAPSKRTLQRRLADLVKKGSIEKHGDGRGTYYQLPPMGQPLVLECPKESYIVLTQEAASIQKYVNQPLEKRKPVNYHPKFLTGYEPNKTYYLPESMREKLLIMAKQPGEKQPAGTFARKLLNELLIDLSWNSSRLEGNSYTLIETKQLIESGTPAKNKSLEESEMIINHKSAIEFLIDASDQINFNSFTIYNLHALLARNLISDKKYYGRIRDHEIAIGKSTYEPLKIPQRIQEYFDIFLQKADAIKDPLEQSFFALVHIPYLQAFLDINKRTSRLAANIPLIKNNFSPISFTEVPTKLYIESILGVYELNDVTLLRELFYWAYKRSSALYSMSVYGTAGEPNPIELEHFHDIRELAKHIIQNKLSQEKATEYIQRWARKNIDEENKTKFIEIIETDLITLHEGSIVRFRVTLDEFKAWKKVWDQG